MLPSEISDIKSYLESILDGKATLVQSDFDIKYKNYLNFLETFYKNWFRKNKQYSDKHIAEKLFVKEIKSTESRDWVRTELYALIKSSDRLYDNIINYSQSNSSSELKHEVKIFSQMLFEAAVFLDYGSQFVHGSRLGYNCGKRNALHSKEVFDASTMLLREMSDSRRLGQFVMPAISIFSIRQAIELRLRYSLGIGDICDNKGKMIKIPAEIFIQVYKKMGKINSNGFTFPIEFSILLKILQWSQFFVHGGFVAYIWEIEWAHYILSPLFSGGKHGKNHSAYGSIKICKHLYSLIPDILKEITAKKKKGIWNCIIQFVFRNKWKSSENIMIQRIDPPESLIV